MDRSWMNESHISPEYEEGVEQRQILDNIREHLLCDGIKRNYTTWIWHGEMKDMQGGPQSKLFDVEMGDRLEDMIRLDDTPQPKSKAAARWIVVKTIGSKEIQGASHPVDTVLSKN
ncbi:hypothetical protein HKD37_01G000954 [Glycine soja]